MCSCLPRGVLQIVCDMESGRAVEGTEVTIRPAGMAPSMPRFGVFVREFFPETDPNLQVTVVRDGQEVESRFKPFEWEAYARGDYIFEIEAAAPPTREEETFSVSGEVTRSNGEPATGVVVRAHDRDLRKRQLLDEVTTCEGGDYKITHARN